MASLLERNNVNVRGAGEQAIVFGHGFGCDQNMWRFVAPAFEKDFETVTFDHVGAGGSDLSAYDAAKYSSLAGYADDLVEIGRELELQDAVFVGHSVSSMIGVLAAQKAPGLFAKLILSTTMDMSAVSAQLRSTSFCSFWNPTIWAGQLRWRPRSWAIRTGPNSAKN